MFLTVLTAITHDFIRLYHIAFNNRTMGILKKVSLSALSDRFGQSFKRFPVAMILVIFLTCFLIYRNHGGCPGGKLDFFLIFYPATGALLAVALSLLTEDFKSRIAAVFTQVVLHTAWFGVSAYLAQFDRFSIPQMIAVSATIASFGFAIFLLCFYRRNHEVPFWNFSIRTIVSLAAAGVIGGILTLGLILLVESLKMLFGLDFDPVIYMDIWSICMVLLAPSLFMILIPEGENKYNTALPEYSRFAKGVVQYLFMPLLGLYLITLYAYAAKILFQWSLPVGGVSYLVTGSMVLMVLLIYITYPIQHLEGNKLFKAVTRWLPVAMLPLLALMTVAIGRRLSDYGITVSRLYLLVFNLWCYAVCLWLIFTRNKRIWLIPASFAVILFLISVGPQSIPNVTLNQLKGEARNAFESAGFTQFPLSADQYESWINKVDKNTAARIDSKLDYLQDYYRYQGLEDLIGKDVVLGRIAQMEDSTSNNSGYEYYSNSMMMHRIDIPAGYAHLESIESSDCLKRVDGDLMTIVLATKNGEEHTFEVSVKSLIALDQEKWQDQSPDPLVLQNGESMFVVNQYTLSINGRKTVDFVNLEGLLFTK